MAQECGYRVKGLAFALGCSCRWVELQFREQLGMTPHRWLVQLRADEIGRRIGTGAEGKELCQQLGFADAASLCHSVKRSTGCTLKQLRAHAEALVREKTIDAGSPTAEEKAECSWQEKFIAAKTRR